MALCVNLNNKGRRGTNFLFLSRFRVVVGRMCEKSHQLSIVYQGSTAILCGACALSFDAANYHFVLSLSFLWQIHICVPNFNVICSTVQFKDQKNHF